MNVPLSLVRKFCGNCLSATTLPFYSNAARPCLIYRQLLRVVLPPRRYQSEILLEPRNDLNYQEMVSCPTCQHRTRRRLALRCRLCGTYLRRWLIFVYIGSAIAVLVIVVYFLNGFRL